MLHVHSLMLHPLVKVKGNGLLRLVPPLKKRQWRHIDILVSHGVHGRKLALCVNLAKAKALGKRTVLSMASTKIFCHNIFLMKRIISELKLIPNAEINRRL